MFKEYTNMEDDFNRYSIDFESTFPCDYIKASEAIEKYDISCFHIEKIEHLEGFNNRVTFTTQDDSHIGLLPYRGE